MKPDGSALEQAWREWNESLMPVLLPGHPHYRSRREGFEAGWAAARAPVEAAMERELHRQRLSYAEVQERSERTRQDLMDERARRMAAEAKSEQMRNALRRMIYEAEHVWPKADPTRAHCPFCLQAAPQQGDPPAHLDWCRVLEARAALPPVEDQQQ